MASALRTRLLVPLSSRILAAARRSALPARAHGHVCPKRGCGSTHGQLKQLREIPRAMVGREERDDNVFRPAALTAKSQTHVDQREAIAQALAQFHEREPRRVPALPAVGPEVVAVIDVRQGGGLKLREFHGAAA
jgi:hypothetical protein